MALRCGGDRLGLKRNALMNELKPHFGPCLGFIWTIEYQKRGLLHVHTYLFLSRDVQFHDPAVDDDFIRAPARIPMEVSCRSSIRKYGTSVASVTANDHKVREAIDMGNEWAVPYNPQLILPLTSMIASLLTLFLTFTSPVARGFMRLYRTGPAVPTLKAFEEARAALLARARRGDNASQFIYPTVVEADTLGVPISARPGSDIAAAALDIAETWLGLVGYLNSQWRPH
ncbi:hypothetical protein K470DRAFT_262260 [Piedraia hortae CBS 480.64]|uniref:Helitron helicase-like domain-containing protein n=1 Tax=Piedraia hortae CBS 480.64 TaxID=1314780 RepID=A0A6A7C7B5_9PEZI|nr:hypothetical protein K470DRAFT_262260 [Piedraia hortae CBS 480.64]